MNTKYNYTAKIVNNNNEILTLNYCDGLLLCVNTGRAFPFNLRYFRTLIKNNGNDKIKRSPNLKTGEFININTGKINKLFGIE